MYKKVNVVMLPTNVSKRYNCTEGLIVKCVKSWTPIGEAPKEIDKLSISKNWSKGVLDYYEPQHLYFTSDEEIKGGDWCLNSYDNQIWKYKPSPCPLPYWGNKDTLTKIIATDTSLISINEQYFDVNKSRKSAVLEQKTLPRISQQFIELYCKKYNEGNPITEIMVEYNYELSNDEDEQGNLIPDIYLKVNSDNTINIKSIKDSWSREEVIKLCRSAHLHGEQGALDIHYQTFKQWIEENL